ncbi:putative leucine-rich repeat-containing protein DDB_G0290503 isoform X3 [Zeugodacus cucurbitae]|uniref:putative leucine-rich repeat-containing protein DDB_G0290503 isoform X3 n=1 Tax=Zeugodacus cucurbitae TaxID=28588 RepID=UPI000596852D|nr:putative leucine-rich repeat-containing protein DDB_G0290503 isoform X3 [Zeugodacus cucurbitae]
MTGTRFARTGRCRFFACLAVLTAMLCMVAIFHSSQQQLDETREQRLRCERQQEQLNEQLQNMVEQKYNQQKTLEQERNEQMEARHNLEQKLKELTILRTKEQMDIEFRYDKLQQAHTLLKSEHDELVTECQKSKKELLESTNALEKKLQSARSEADKEKNVLNGEITLWREKYNSVFAEKERLEILLNASGKKTELHSKIISLEHIIAQYEQHCDYKPETRMNNEKPLNPPNISRNTSPQTRIEKSFNEQVRILPKPIEKVADGVEADAKILNQMRQPPANQSEASANNKLILPLSAPRKAATTETSKSEQHVLEVNAPITNTNNTSTTSGAFPPLPMPPNPRKLPENVAPIPANFEELLKEDNANQKPDVAKAANINAPQELQKNENEGAKNDRYANAINEMEPKASHKEQIIASANAANEDSGAHEIKDNDFINDQNFNLPANEENNFFDGGVKNEPVGNVEEKPKGEDNDDDEGLVGAVDAGDIAVKNHNLLDTNNLNNEVAGDQGKEFPDELRLEENNEEDEDEDDYSNPGARQQGEQAIRN